MEGETEDGYKGESDGGDEYVYVEKRGLEGDGAGGDGYGYENIGEEGMEEGEGEGGDRFVYESDEGD